MPYPCFKCDVELVAGARFCHQCGAPNLLEQNRRRADPQVPVEEEERYRIKRDIQEAASLPTSTRMIQTVLPPLPAASRTPIKPPGWGERVVKSRFWTRAWIWAGLVLVVLLAATANIIVDLKDRLQDTGELNRALTHLAARCPKDSKTQLLDWATKIQKTLPGTRSTADAAELLDVVVNDVTISDGSCARVAERLTRADRFAPLAQ